MEISKLIPVFLLSLLFSSSDVQSQLAFEECVVREVNRASDNGASEKITVKQIQEMCAGNKPSTPEIESVTVEVPIEGGTAVEKRRAVESIAEALPFILMPHKSNYVLPLTYNQTPNQSVFNEDELDVDRAETKFQFSVKSRVAEKLFLNDGDLWFAYTNLSFWQSYNAADSAQFRETNHEPEVFLEFHPRFMRWNWETDVLRIGVNHQSNGQGGGLSRSWNRVYALFTIENNDWYFGIKPWYRIPESRKDSPNDSRGDDNPDLYRYVGYGDLLTFYKWDDYTIGATFRNNLQSNNRFGLQLDLTFPLKDKLRGYLQFYTGYGESLIDYNASVNRIGIGVMFSDLL